MDNIQLGMTLDLKPFIASLQSMPGVSKETIAVIQQLFATVKPPKITPERTEISLAEQDLQRLKQAYYMLTLGEDNATIKAYKFAKSQNLSSSQIDLLVNSMLKEQSALSITSAEYGAVQGSINNLIAAKQRMIQASAGGGRALRQMGGSTMSLNYILRDSPFLFQRLDMGIMAISNNLNPFIDDMIRAKAATGSWKAAISQMTSGLMGVGGLSVAFSLIVATIQAVSFIMAKGTAETNKMKDAVKELKTELEQASYTTLKSKEIETRIKLLDEEQKLLDKINKSQLDMEKGPIRNRGEVGKPIKQTVLGAYQTNEEIDNLKKRLEVITDAQNKLGLVKERNNKVAELEAHKLTLRSEKEIAEVDKQIEALNKKYKLETEKKGSEDAITKSYRLLTLTNEQLRAERELNLVKLNDPDFNGSRVQTLEKILSIDKQIATNAKEYFRLYDSQTAGIPSSFDMSFTENIPKPEVFKETNDELVRMLELSDAVTTSFNRAATAVASAAAAGIYVFKQENSLLQIFINNLIRAAAEAITLKLITMGLDIVGSFLGIPGLGSGVGAATSGGSFGGGNAPMINPGGTGLSNLSMAANSASYRYNGNTSGAIIQQVPIVLATEVHGRSLRILQKREIVYRRKYAGAVNG